MIGLCMGLAFMVYREGYPKDTAEEIAQTLMLNAAAGLDGPFGMVTRDDAEADPGYVLSRRYYQLLDACPLRMSTADQSNEVHS